MRIPFLFLSMFVGVAAFASDPVCVTLDDRSGDANQQFSRCITHDIICYVSESGQYCRPRTAEAVPSPIPSAQPSTFDVKSNKGDK